MSHHDLISSYLDNELSHEQEQEFLISLAANDHLRQSFRSELVLKKIVHRDDSLTAPPRELRTAVFATVGLSAIAAEATAVTAATTATASSGAGSTLLIKALFASKLNTLVAALGLTAAATVGYVTNDAIDAKRTADKPAATSIRTTAPVSAPAPTLTETKEEVKPDVAVQSNSTKSTRIKTRVQKPAAPATVAEPQTDATSIDATTTDGAASGVGEAGMEEPIIKRK